MDLLTKHTTSNNRILKFIAMSIFILLPIISFFFGIKYQEALYIKNPSITHDKKIIQPTPPIATKTAWKTYINKKYGYSINYPSNWTVREYSNSSAGATFRPLSKPNDPQYEYITIERRIKILSDEKDVPFDEYVKIAAKGEIQNYIDIKTMKKVVSDSGVMGYETTWKVMSIGGRQSGESSPITYFPVLPDSKATIQITLEEVAYQDIYDKMLSSFNYLK